ncbi:MAG: tetratricopeptide repeat protein [Desulfovibrio sp.]|jgi:tetratricopeptide (TPR) repeat protein|nr:tetratricopeptide repeat protein [Desulfovibrio sp.]
MSQELTRIGESLQRVAADLKKGNFLAAAHAVRNGADALTGTPMTGETYGAIESLLVNACDRMQSTPALVDIFPDGILYVPGQEHNLSALMGRLLQSVEQQGNNGDNGRQEKNSSTRDEFLARARAALQAGKENDARNELAVLDELYPQDGELHLETGILFLDFGLTDDAVAYLEKAAGLLPDSARVLNILGVTLRKVRRCEESERYFLRAVQASSGDPHLFFNLGRLYIDTGQWSKAVECAEKALALDPDFESAARMRAFAERGLSRR